MLDVAVQAKVSTTSGSFSAYAEVRFGWGQPKSKAVLGERPELVEAIRKDVRRAR